MEIKELLKKLNDVDGEKRIIISFASKNGKIEFHYIGFGDESVYPASDLHEQFEKFNRLIIGNTISSNGGCKHWKYGYCESTTGQLDKPKSYKVKDFLKRLKLIINKYDYNENDEVHLDYDDGVDGKWYSNSIQDVLELKDKVVICD